MKKKKPKKKPFSTRGEKPDFSTHTRVVQDKKKYNRKKHKPIKPDERY